MSENDSVSTPPSGAPAHKGLITWFAANPVAANLLMAFLIVGGVAAGFKVPIQAYPELDVRTVSVFVKAPGSSAVEVEEDITRRVEEAIIGIAGIERVVGTAQNGLGDVQVEISTFADPDTVLNDVQNAVDSIENFPPLNAERPEVKLVRWLPRVITVAVSSSSASEDELRSVAERLRRDLLVLPTVSQVNLKGTQDREIAIELDETALRRNTITLAQIANRVGQASANITIGELRSDAGGMVLHIVEKRRVGEQYEDLPVITRTDGTIIRLGDIASIRDGFVDDRVITRVDGKPTVLVNVMERDKVSAIDTGEDVQHLLSDYSTPPGISVDIWDDRFASVADQMSRIADSAVIGIILVFVALILVFDLRTTFWLVLGVPLAFVGSLLFFPIGNLTLNVGTLFAFFLLVGIVVDDAIVVGESIATERQNGKRGLDAAIAGAQAVAAPVIVGVITTLIAASPLFFLSSGYYQVISVVPYVMLFVLAVSLAEAFLILPAHLSYEQRWSLSPLSDIQRRVSGWVEQLRDAVVAPAAAWSVRNVWLPIGLGALAVVAAWMLLETNAVRVMLWDRSTSGPNYVQADFQLPIGTPIEETVKVAEQFAAAARNLNGDFEVPPIKSVSIIVGDVVAPHPARTPQAASHIASVRAHLYAHPARTASVGDIERAWRTRVRTIPALEHSEFFATRIRQYPDVAYSVWHDDIDTLKTAVQELTGFLGTVSGLYGIADSLAPGKRHFEIELTPAGMAAELTAANIGSYLRANLIGVEVERIQRGNDELRVVVRYPEDNRRGLQDLVGERIRYPGGYIPLSVAARITETRDLALRKRIDGRQVVLVEARADGARVTPRKARRIVENDIVPQLLARYPGLRIERDGLARNENTISDMLRFLVPLALLAMYGVMAALLRSYWKPVIGMVGIPLAFAGAVFMHLILGWDFSFMSMFGVLAVSGVIVNDSLVLMDRYNRIRREYSAIPALAAAASAARLRFRAVFLTSLTTILGLSPLLYERSDELLFMVPFISSVMGGLIASSLFVLFMLPALMMVIEGRKE